MNYPKRFEMEGITNPEELPVKLVEFDSEGKFKITVYENTKAVQDVYGVNVTGFLGPMADIHDNKRCVRFESKRVYRTLSV